MPVSDPIALELFRNSNFSIADEMVLTVFRTAYSGALKDNAVFDCYAVTYRFCTRTHIEPTQVSVISVSTHLRGEQFHLGDASGNRVQEIHAAAHRFGCVRI